MELSENKKLMLNATDEKNVAGSENIVLVALLNKQLNVYNLLNFKIKHIPIPQKKSLMTNVLFAFEKFI